MSTTAIFFPFDLFGSPGTRKGAELLADAFAELLADNRREKLPIRAGAYQNEVRTRELSLDKMPDYQDWRQRARQAVRQAWRRTQFLLWITGNHLGVLPVYDELSKASSETLVIQLDAHLDVYNLADCTAELSHGNFLLHCAGTLPALINIGSRELLLAPEHVRKFYRWTFSADELAVDPAPALQRVRAAAHRARRVFIDIDCDCLDPAFFPAVSQPVPFGLSPQLLLRFLDAAWSSRVVGLALSEFDPRNDPGDRCLETLMWLLEWLLLRRYEK